MSITISLTGEVLECQEPTQEQRDALWREVVRIYCRRHPEMFTGAGGEDQAQGAK